MKVIPFPGEEGRVDDAAIAELEAALAGAATPGAEAWRRLSSDVRALAPPIDARFEAALHERLGGTRQATLLPEQQPGRARRAWRWWTGRPLAPRLVSLGGAGALCAVVIAIVIAGLPTDRKGPSVISAPAYLSTQNSAGAKVQSSPAIAPAASAGATHGTLGPVQASGEASSAGATQGTPGPVQAPGGASSPGRVQQLGASLTLAGSPEEVQRLADGVSRVVIAEGGYVSSSQVQVERGATNDATLVVSVPAARLARTLSALGRLGAVRAETQSLQDITNSYDGARSALGDAVAERAALLRALAHASTQGEIESIHRRLAIVGGTIERDRAAFGRISSQAANANLEVDVVGEAHPSAGGLSVARGLHDAGRVLTVTLAVLLIGLAALIPLLAICFALALSARAWRRAARERALGER
jgi:hypothetical protein